ncbi:putative heat shock protein 75 [Cardiosporidium cionae]|uniref:Heat shock protein 75 n=1 Tax=Cardiosporidium cionae TaxID=476202 RepID=A0ABQ7J480_9APIC|nr:putative heat shock protein 75 [Cardiosporidium cionae]|eukprot:KAF8817854.1 putative heat shock protein 75 [Cardiosporidium cionae]
MDPEKYSKFYRGYSYFLKEGLLDDVQHKNQYKDTLMKLLRFECSNEDAKTMISFDDYIAKMHPKQQNLYYFCASDRKTAMASPYLEQFLKKNRNVLLLYEDIDEFVAMNIQKYQDKKLVAVDASEEDFEPLLEENEQGEDISQENIQTLALLEDQKTDLEGYIKSVLGEKVTAIKYSDRLVSSPAIVTGFLSSSLRKMMKATMRGSGDSQMGLTSLPVTLELNPSHSIVTSLFYLKTENPTVAKIVTEQLYDNACIAAGILDDPRSILERLNSLLEVTIRYAYHHTAASSPVSEDSPTPSESVGEVKTNEEEVHVSPPDVHSTEVTDPSENTKGHPTSP